MPIRYTFRALSFEKQLPLVWLEGMLLVRCWEEEDAVALSHMDRGFFCEVYLEQENFTGLWPRTFLSAADLEDYATYIGLAGLHI